MPNYLNVPPELNHLIEKRDGPQRRQSESPCQESDAPTDVSGDDHRENRERRQQTRRAEDS